MTALPVARDQASPDDGPPDLPVVDPPRAGSAGRRRARGRAAGASVVIGLGGAAVPMLAGGAPLRAQALLAGAGVVALVVALLGHTPGFTVAAIGLGAEYALRLAPRHGLDRLDGLAVIEAVVLFTMVEVGLRSLDERTIARPESLVRRAASWRLAAMITGAGASALIVLAVGSRRLPAPTAGLALGLAAATALLVSAELVRCRVTRDATAVEHAAPER